MGQSSWETNKQSLPITKMKRKTKHIITRVVKGLKLSLNT